MTVVGYHGTAQKNVSSIEKQGLKFSRGSRQWLGDGIYFFETLNNITNGSDEAKYWVIKVKREANWAVFQANIESNAFIDLVSSEEHKRLFLKARENAIRIHKKSKNADKPFNEARIYYGLRKCINVDFLRVLVNADNYGKYGYKSYTVLKPQVQLCVIKTDCIKENKLFSRGSVK